MDPRDWREFRPCDAVIEMHLVLGDRDRDHQEEEFRLAYEELARCYLRVILSFCTRLLGASGGARTPEDVTQEVFLQAYQAMPRFQRNASVRTWLFAIARTECFQVLRNYGTRKRLDASHSAAIAQTVHTPASQTPEEELVKRADEEWTQEREALLRSSLSTLPKRQQELLTLRYLAGVSVADIAKQYFCSETAIRTRLTDALKALRRVQEKAERTRRITPHGGL